MQAKEIKYGYNRLMNLIQLKSNKCIHQNCWAVNNPNLLQTMKGKSLMHYTKNYIQNAGIISMHWSQSQETAMCSPIYIGWVKKAESINI